MRKSECGSGKIKAINNEVGIRNSEVGKRTKAEFIEVEGGIVRLWILDLQNKGVLELWSIG